MSQRSDPPPPHRDNPPASEEAGAIAAASRVGTALISALPPAFLGLLMINTVFLGVTYWFLSHEMAQRTEYVGKIIDSCLLEHRIEPQR